MKRRDLFLLIVALSLPAALPLRASAADESGHGLTLQAANGSPFAAPAMGTAVAVRVTGIVARARVTQIFVNPTSDWVEGIYVFPLPDNAVVDDLRMTIGDRTLRGVVREKQQAAAVYAEAKERGHRASLVELQRRGVFTTAVANLGPGEKVEITIEMQQVVEYGRGRFGLRFPMVVPPRYAPRAEDALPIPAPVAGPAAPSFSFHVDLAPGFPLGRVESRSHQIAVKRDERGRRYSVSLAAGVAPADADFLLEWTPAVGREPNAVFFTEKVGDERYALLMVMPPDTSEAAAARLPRETIFVIDTSGSMSGTPLQQAREALVLGIERLQPTDSFNVIRFSSQASALFPRSVPADMGAVETAKSWVRKLEVDGGTEMLSALQLALPQSVHTSGAPLRQVIFATDGQVSNEAELLGFIAKNLGQSRLYSIAIGPAPNAAFLRSAAALGGGTFTAIADVAQVKVGMDDLFARIETPLLRDVAVQWSDATAEAWPQRIPDLYLGEPIVVAARLRGEAGPVVVEGLQGESAWRVDIPVAGEVKGAGLDKLWAGQKVQALLDTLTGGADAGEVERQVTALGLSHRLLTPYTSFVVVEETPVRPPEAPLVKHCIPGAAPRSSSPATLAFDPALSDPDSGTSGVADVITVTAESPLLDARRLSTGATVSQTELEKIPTARDPWAILQSTPGVHADRINVGGNESGHQSRYVGPGSTMAQSTWSVDGMVITDMVALGSSPAYYDFDAFEEMQVSTGGSDSTIAGGGVVLNLVTKRGTNEWRGSGRYYRGDDAGSSVTGVSYANGGVDYVNRLVKGVEYGAEVGGPIVLDRFWAWGAYGTQQVDRQTIPGLVSSTDLDTASLKLNAQVSSNNSATLLAFDSDKVESGADAGAFRPRETTWNQSRRGDSPTATKIEDTHIFSSNFYLTGGYSKVESGDRLTPRGGTERTAFQDGAGRWHHTFAQLESDRPQRQLDADASLFFNTGYVSHEVKAGAGRREADARSSTHWGAGYSLSAEHLNGTDDLLVASRDAFGDATNRYTSVYVQDLLSKGHLNVNVGLRYDLQEGELAARSVGANPTFTDLLPAATFDGGGAGFEWESLVPRLGLTYAVGPERKTLLRGSYSRFADQLGIGTTSQLDPLAVPSYVYLALNGAAGRDGSVVRGDVRDRNGDGVVDLGDAVGFSGAYDPSGRGLLQSNGVDPGLRPPTTDELLLSAEHAILPELVFGLHLAYRRLTGLLENELLVFDGDPYAAENLASIGRRHTRADYVPVAVSRPGGLPDGSNSTYTYWQLRPGVGSRGGTFLENGDRDQEYRGASLSVDKRLINGWMLRGNFTWSDWRWRVSDGELEDPTRFLGGGFDGEAVLYGGDSGVGGKRDVYINTGWSYDLNGLYQVAPARRWGFNVTLNITGREGYPLPWYERLGYGQRSGIPGFTDVQVVGNDDFRLDDLHLVDAGVEKELVFADFGVTLGLDCFNLLDERITMQRNLRLGVGPGLATSPSGPAAGAITEIVGPRTFRARLRISFR